MAATAGPVMLATMTSPWPPPESTFVTRPPVRDGPRMVPRSRVWIGLGLIAFAFAGAVFAALPYFDVGPDTSPNSPTYIERRYGNIGVGLTVFWLIAMAVLVVVGIVVTLYGTIRRRHGTPQ